MNADGIEIGSAESDPYETQEAFAAAIRQLCHRGNFGPDQAASRANPKTRASINAAIERDVAEMYAPLHDREWFKPEDLPGIPTAFLSSANQQVNRGMQEITSQLAGDIIGVMAEMFTAFENVKGMQEAAAEMSERFDEDDESVPVDNTWKDVDVSMESVFSPAKVPSVAKAASAKKSPIKPETVNESFASSDASSTVPSPVQFGSKTAKGDVNNESFVSEATAYSQDGSFMADSPSPKKPAAKTLKAAAAATTAATMEMLAAAKDRAVAMEETPAKKKPAAKKKPPVKKTPFRRSNLDESFASPDSYDDIMRQFGHKKSDINDEDSDDDGGEYAGNLTQALV